jgi:hypothetical protein
MTRKLSRTPQKCSTNKGRRFPPASLTGISMIPSETCFPPIREAGYEPTLSALGITFFSIDVSPHGPAESVYQAAQIGSYSLSVATTVLSTVIIVIRILKVSRMPGASRKPHFAIEIIIESAVLYSLSALLFTSMTATFTTHSATYYLYTEAFFAYMAVESHPSLLPVLIF